MVAVFLRLKLHQIANSVRRPPAQLLGLFILLAYGIAATSFGVQYIDSIRESQAGLANSLVVIGGSIITIGFLVFPLIFGTDDPADPRAFTPYGLSAHNIAVGLTASSLISVPMWLLFVVVGAQVGAWAEHPDAFLSAVLSGIVIVALAAVGARFTRAIATLWLGSRRAQQAVGIASLAGLLFATPVILQLASAVWGTRASSARLSEVATALGQTPIGAPWAAPALAASGDLGGSALNILTGAGLALVLWFGWRILVGRMLVTRHAEVHSATRGGLGWFAVLPGVPAGAVAARAFTYWLRDGRYRLALAVIPVVPILLIVPFLIAGVWWQNLALIPLPVMCLFLGWMIHNDAAADNTALWLHLASHTSGWADRLGRAVPALIVGIPLIAIGAPATVQLYGVPNVLPSVVGVSICVLLAGLGLSSYVSARFPYPAVRPGDSPFAQPQTTSASPGQAISFVGTIVLAVPVLAFAATGMASDAHWHLIALWAGVGIGLATFALGLAAGARAFRKRAPELLAFTLRN